MQDSGSRNWTYLADATAVLGALAVFLALAFHQIDLPGLYNDEAMDVVPAMQLLLGQDVELARGAGITIGDRTYPLMSSDYQGAVSTYLVLPFFHFLGVGALAIRALSISFGAAAVVLTYFVGRALFNRTAGVTSTFLLAVMPAFVFWSRIGLYVVNQVVPIGLASLLCLIAWRRRGGWWYLAGAGFLMGLGLSTKLLFLWFITSLVAALLTLEWRRVVGAVRKGGLRSILIGDAGKLGLGPPRWRPVSAVGLALGGLAAGASPFLLYNLQTMGTYRVVRANLFGTEHGVNNFDFLSNLLVEADAFKVLLDGGYFWFQGGVFSNPIAPWALAALAAILGVLVFAGLAPPGFGRSGLFVSLMVALIFLQSCFTVSGLWATHLLVVLPFPQLLAGAGVAAAVWWLKSAASPQRVAVAVLALLLPAGIVAFDLKTDFDYHEALSRSGGYTSFSDGIYDLAAYLEENQVSSPLAVDWGIKSSVQILTEGRVNPREIYGTTREVDEDFRRRVADLVEDPDNVYIFRTRESTAYEGRLEVFREAASSAGLKVKLAKVFYHRDGKPLFGLFKVVPRS